MSDRNKLLATYLSVKNSTNSSRSKYSKINGYILSLKKLILEKLRNQDCWIKYVSDKFSCQTGNYYYLRYSYFHAPQTNIFINTGIKCSKESKFILKGEECCRYLWMLYWIVDINFFSAMTGSKQLEWLQNANVLHPSMKNAILSS